MKKSKNSFYRALIARYFPSVVPEYSFYPARKWKSDYAIVEHKILIEIEGGVWTQGRHTRGEGYSDDLIKYNMANKLGFMLLRYTPQQLGELEADMEELYKKISKTLTK